MEVLAIVGPTGTGKSDLVLNVAESIGQIGYLTGRDCEVINADAFSLYRGMDIGTAKVLPAERRGIPHHLIDIYDPMDVASIADYQELGRAALAEVIGRGNLPIVVGGSGLYVRALLDGFDLPGTDPAVRNALSAQLDELGIAEMFRRLSEIDPAAAATIGNRNARRIIRALEVIQLTGKPFMATLPDPVYRYDTVAIGLDFNRSLLDARISQRVGKMRDLGLLAEVAGLANPDQGGTGAGLGPTAVRAVGYYELLPVLRGEVDVADGFAAVEVHTRQLTRKQMGWFGRDHRIKWFNGGAGDLTAQALEYLRNPQPAPQPRRASEPGANQGLRTPLGSTLST